MITYDVVPCERKEIAKFIEEHHYSKNMNGVNTSYAFKLLDGDKLIGAMIYGRLGMANVWKKYGENIEDVIELKRLCCIDNTLKNTESFFIGKTIRWLKQNTNIKIIVSYADPYYNHEGTIYKATNFKYNGTTYPAKHILYNNKLYHEKTPRNKYKGKLKPYALKIKNALESGEAVFINTPGKHIYTYNLRKKRGQNNVKKI
jgi:hypothetical protein